MQHRKPRSGWDLRHAFGEPTLIDANLVLWQVVHAELSQCSRRNAFARTWAPRAVLDMRRGQIRLAGGFWQAFETVKEVQFPVCSKRRHGGGDYVCGPSCHGAEFSDISLNCSFNHVLNPKQQIV